MNVLENENLRPELLKRAGMLLSTDGDEELDVMLTIIENHPNKDEMIDWIEGVSPCESQEYTFTVKSFLESIGA